MDRNEPTVEPSGALVALEDSVGVPVFHVLESRLRFGDDDFGHRSDVGDSTSIGSSPSPDVAKHLAVELHQEAVLEEAVRSKHSRLLDAPSQRLRNVVELDSVHICSGRHEVRNEPLEVFLLDWCGASRLKTDGLQ